MSVIFCCRICRGVWFKSWREGAGVTCAGVGAYKAVEQAAYLEELVGKYPIDSIEDGMAENDWEGWRLLTDRIGGRCQLVGDDLFVTNTEYLRKGIESGCANAILVKVN